MRINMYDRWTINMMDSCPHWPSLLNYCLALFQINLLHLLSSRPIAMISHHWVSRRLHAFGHSSRSGKSRRFQANTSPYFYGENYRGLRPYLISQLQHPTAIRLHHLAQSHVLRSSHERSARLIKQQLHKSRHWLAECPHVLFVVPPSASAHPLDCYQSLPLNPCMLDIMKQLEPFSAVRKLLVTILTAWSIA